MEAEARDKELEARAREVEAREVRARAVGDIGATGRLRPTRLSWPPRIVGRLSRETCDSPERARRRRRRRRGPGEGRGGGGRNTRR